MFGEIKHDLSGVPQKYKLRGGSSEIQCKQQYKDGGKIIGEFVLSHLRHL